MEQACGREKEERKEGEVGRPSLGCIEEKKKEGEREIGLGQKRKRIGKSLLICSHLFKFKFEFEFNKIESNKTMHATWMLKTYFTYIYFYG